MFLLRTVHRCRNVHFCGI